MRTIKECSVAVVGGAGFLGSHLVDHLIEDQKCKVTVVDNLCSGRREFIHPKANFQYADITGSEEHLASIFRDNRCQYVFNYAAHPYVPLSYSRPLHVFETNATGALKVINAAHSTGAEGILQVSSAEVYGECTGLHQFLVKKLDRIDEDFPVIPHSSYGTSKAAIDSMVQVRWKEAKTPCIALRQFNCVGARETHPYVVPEIISQLFRIADPKGMIEGGQSSFGFPIVSLGNNTERDFLHAKDAVRMAVELLERGKFGEVYNCGSQESIHIYSLAQKIATVAGMGRIIVQEDVSRIRPWEIWYLQSNNTKLYSVIEYRPRYSLEDALRDAIDSFVLNGKKWFWK